MKIKIKTCELSAANLDWAVAKIEGCSKKLLMNYDMWLHIRQLGAFRFSTEWSSAGPIIAKHRINCAAPDYAGGKWVCSSKEQASGGALSGQTIQHCGADDNLLTAAMRCYVASKLGAEIAVPGYES